MTDTMNMVSSENEALLQNKTDLLSQLHDLEEARKNALDRVSSMLMRYMTLFLCKKKNVMWYTTLTSINSTFHASCTQNESTRG